MFQMGTEEEQGAGPERGLNDGFLALKNLAG